MFDIAPRRSRDLFDWNHVFQDFFTDFDGKVMRLDIKETDIAYILDVEIPGVTKDDIHLLVNDDVLTVNVTIPECTDEAQTKYIRKERKFGSMTRSFTIRDIDENTISAKYDLGVLTITVPKIVASTEDQTKRITIE